MATVAETWFSVLGLLVLVLCILVAHLKSGRKRWRLPPAPPGLPFLGNILELNRDQKTFILLHKWSKIYGDIFRLQIGSMNAVVLSSYDVVKEALLEKPAHFADRPDTLTGAITSEGGQDITFSNTGPTWKLHRKIANSCLRNFITGQNLEEIVRDRTLQMLDIMGEENAAFDPSTHIKLGVYNIVCGMCFNQRYTFDDPEFKELENTSEQFVDIFGRGLPEDYFPFLKYIPSKASKDLRHAVQSYLNIIEKHWHQHNSTYVEGNQRDIMDLVIEIQREAKKKDDSDILEAFTDTRVIQTIFNLLEGGINVISLQTLWLILHLALHQKAQENIYKEIQEVLGTAVPCGTHRHSMPYTEAALSESLRHGTMPALGLPHTATRDSTLGGFDIPKGTTIIINQWSLHRDQRHWVDPETFRPERFLNADGKFLPKPPGFLPFSTGTRSCIGEPMTRLTMFLQLVMLLQRFQILPPPGESLTLEPADSGIVSMPKPYKIVVKRR
ncbi:steroid 17-alpha-hydroxylase/17,20 lyase [Lingula anatina]|uniref:Steroid 17-alpha-hydroxylase/17,20 lyase n=1 Tax=Lingula anatina TaxID=7574 RepID=A0A1S3HYF0_LINAN|nr:steroid 17-alpha-hydroxylase/17,20 lyase [Lingula anatina]|eukprot:XP_013391052.1 steroid 17-alpha-hydroxylase/17,20 lyase [Lingula anatina]